MKKGLMKSNKMGQYELERGFASYRTLVEYFIGDIVLCNNITEIDESVYDNMQNGCYYRNRLTNEYATLEEYNNDMEDIIELEYVDIYQYFLCNINDYDRDFLTNAGFVLSYSDMLECDVLCVDHFGTSWDYVLTDVKLFDSYEDLKEYEESEELENE